MYKISDYRRIWNKFNYACIELENGMKITPDMYEYMIELGLIDSNND